jgi:alpha-glutamyl/putrescinyl thymine pyrophosphorylase clade 1
MKKSPYGFARLSPPEPRPGVYELYWTFASRRQAAFEARLAGQRWPWSEDWILRTYKFCNVYRAADRVSQYLIRDVAYKVDMRITSSDRLFQIVAFRTFSKIKTWEALAQQLDGAPRLEHLRNGEFESALNVAKSENGGLYTGAFILCANKVFGFNEKHRNHVALFKHMFLEDDCAEKLLNASSLEAVVRTLEGYPLIGPFMAYQIAIDLNYSDLLPFDENDYTQAGPGALRGLKKAFVSLGDYSPADAILWMVERQNTEFQRLGLPFNGLFGRQLHGIDCQGLFCELDKYCREAMPELISARSRIKAKYAATGNDIALFFPPKWYLPGDHVVAAISKAERQDQGLGLQVTSTRKAKQKDFAIRDLFG